MIGTLQSFPRISEVCNSIHVDFTDPEPTSYGLSSMGDSLVFEDVLGNQTRQHSFMLYSVYSALDDFERKENSEALMELAQWLSGKKGAEIETKTDTDIYSGSVTKITTDNGMLIAVPQENTVDGWQYQLQIAVQYTVEKEDF